MRRWRGGRDSVKKANARSARATPKGAPASSAERVPAASDTPEGFRAVEGAFPIVGVGASAGGLEAFTQLLQHAAAATAGWRSCSSSTSIRRTRASCARRWPKTTEMTVEQAEDGMRVEPNHVYVIPPNADLGIRDGLPHARARGQTTRKVPHLPVDFFFRALAAERGSHAIGVVLSGTASDGTEGLRAIKAASGITFAQEPSSAKFGGMPRSARRRRRRRLLPADPGARPGAPAPQPPPVRHRPGVDGGDSATTATLQKIFVLVRRRHRRRLQRVQVADLRAATRAADGAAAGGHARGVPRLLLEGDADEVLALYEDILIHVTSFFRDPEVFETSEDDRLPGHRQGQARDGAHPDLGRGLLDRRRGLLARDRPRSSSSASRARPVQIFGSDVSEQGDRSRPQPASTPTARCATSATSDGGATSPRSSAATASTRAFATCASSSSTISRATRRSRSSTW